ncbi:MAG: aquaporin [Gemmatimonadota bacterium]|nr:aquaporin [Gemmatimonadota bacterium]
MRATLRPLAAEFLGTFALVFVGCGAVVVDAAGGGRIGLGGVAFAHATVYAVMVTAMLPISGGHLNPAVTFAVWMTGRLAWRPAVLYGVTQLLAAAVAVLAVKWLFPAAAGLATSLGVPRIAGAVTFTQAVFLEAVLTAVLVSTVFGTTVSRHAPRVGGFAVGLVLLFVMLVGGPLTGGAVNPARAFGPALVSQDWYGQLAFWLGPALGAAVAAFVWAKLLLPLPGDPEP